MPNLRSIQWALGQKTGDQDARFQDHRNQAVVCAAFSLSSTGSVHRSRDTVSSSTGTL